MRIQAKIFAMSASVDNAQITCLTLYPPQSNIKQFFISFCVFKWIWANILYMNINNQTVRHAHFNVMSYYWFPSTRVRALHRREAMTKNDWLNRSKREQIRNSRILCVCIYKTKPSFGKIIYEFSTFFVQSFFFLFHFLCSRYSIKSYLFLIFTMFLSLRYNFRYFFSSPVLYFSSTLSENWICLYYFNLILKFVYK